MTVSTTKFSYPQNYQTLSPATISSTGEAEGENHQRRRSSSPRTTMTLNNDSGTFLKVCDTENDIISQCNSDYSTKQSSGDISIYKSLLRCHEELMKTAIDDGFIVDDQDDENGDIPEWGIGRDDNRQNTAASTSRSAARSSATGPGETARRQTMPFTLYPKIGEENTTFWEEQDNQEEKHQNDEECTSTNTDGNSSRFITSSFYLSALKEATFTEEEEEDLQTSASAHGEQPNHHDSYDFDQLQHSYCYDDDCQEEAVQVVDDEDDDDLRISAISEASALEEARQEALSFLQQGEEDEVFEPQEQDQEFFSPDVVHHGEQVLFHEEELTEEKSREKEEDDNEIPLSGSFYQSALEEAAFAESRLSFGDDDEEEGSVHFNNEYNGTGILTAMMTPEQFSRTFHNDEDGTSRSMMPVHHTGSSLASRGKESNIENTVGSTPCKSSLSSSWTEDNHRSVIAQGRYFEDLVFDNDYEEEDDDVDIDEDLKLALKLSRLESESSSPTTITAALSYSSSSSNYSDGSATVSSSSRPSLTAVEHEDQNIEEEEFLISQQKAMEECQRTKNARQTSAESFFFPSSEKTASGPRRLSSPAEGNGSRTISPTSSNSNGRQPMQRMSELEMRGFLETRKAMLNGTSRAVKCNGCKGRLQAPVLYSLVYCPNCKTVSPT